MKKESEIRERMENLEKNILLIKNESGKALTERAIAELFWVLKNERC